MPPREAPADARAVLERMLVQQNLRAAVTQLEWRDGRVARRVRCGRLRRVDRRARSPAARCRPARRGGDADGAGRARHGARGPHARALSAPTMVPGRRAVVLFAMLALAVAIAAAWLAPAALLDTRIAACDRRHGAARGHCTARYGTGAGAWSPGRRAFRSPGESTAGPCCAGCCASGWRRGTGAATPRATIAVGTDTLAFHDVDVTLPAQVFGATLSPFGVESVAGEISLKADDIEWTPDAGRGEARVVWRAARVAFAGSAAPLDLGDVRTLVTADGNALSGPVTNERRRPRASRRVGVARARQRAACVARGAAPSRSRRTSSERCPRSGLPDGNGWRIEWRGPLR